MHVSQCLSDAVKLRKRSISYEHVPISDFLQLDDMIYVEFQINTCGDARVNGISRSSGIVSSSNGSFDLMEDDLRI